MQIKQTTYQDISALHISNGVLEMTVLVGVGPRIITAGLVGRDSLLATFPDDFARVPAAPDDHYFYGGHRLWHAPEHPRRTYAPDNAPLQSAQFNDADGTLSLTQHTERETGIQKMLDIRFIDDHRVELTHSLTNHGLWPVTLAVWPLTMMATGGVAVLPLPPRQPHSPQTLLPDSHLSLWGYTDLSDPRWTFCPNYILLRASDANPAPLKIGADVAAGWLAYAHPDGLFIKHFAHDPAARYPDGGCNAEIYTDHNILELETLSPLVELAPSATLTHRETWHIVAPVPIAAGEADVQAHIAPLIGG